MSEIKIQNPCDNCELKYMLDNDEGMGVLALEGLYMATLEKDSLLACRHPWRLLYEAYGRNPDNIQVQVLSKTIEFRGKDPLEYGLEKVDKISTLDL